MRPAQQGHMRTIAAPETHVMSVASDGGRGLIVTDKYGRDIAVFAICDPEGLFDAMGMRAQVDDDTDELEAIAAVNACRDIAQRKARA